jgi:dTDP-4-amino-4,6-dideoxygalactose transaminase
MYISDRPGLSLKNLLSGQNRKGSLPYPFTAPNAFFLNFGRNCIYHAIDILGLQPGDAVLLPAYLDHAVIEPFLIKNITTKFYSINRNLEVDFKDISSKIDDYIKALLVINYFGFPQPLPKLKKFCEAHNVYLIEDNAHGFLSRMDNKYLGSFGDISIFSIRKTIPLPDGAVLVVNNTSLLNFDARLRQPNKLYILWCVTDLLWRDFQSKCNFEIHPIGIVLAVVANLLGKTCNYGKFVMSNLSLKIIREIDFKDVYEQRRANFKFISEKVKDLEGIEPIYKQLPDEVCPWGFPILVNNRERLRRYLRRRGITLPIHWILPRHIPLDDFPDSRFLSEHILTLPVFQGLKKEKLSTLLDMIEAYTKHVQ